METPAPLVFDTTFVPDTGRPVAVTPGIIRVTAPNASPYTFTGTNSFLIGTTRLAIVDPGPDDDQHLAALMAAAAGRPVQAIILTHTHKDHSALVGRLQAATGAPLWFEGPHRLSRRRRPLEPNLIQNSADWSLRPDRVLHDGEMVDLDGVMLETVTTPGHCANHLAFGIPGTEVLLSGDHVMGWSSTLVSTPDGSMADYLASLEKLIALPYRRYLPAHGGPIAEGQAYARSLLAHRQMRNRQVIAAVAAGATSIRQLLSAIYPGLKPGLLLAARMTLMAHVEYLGERGDIAVRYGLFGTRLAPR